MADFINITSNYLVREAQHPIDPCLVTTKDELERGENSEGVLLTPYVGLVYYDKSLQKLNYINSIDNNVRTVEGVKYYYNIGVSELTSSSNRLLIDQLDFEELESSDTIRFFTSTLTINLYTENDPPLLVNPSISPEKNGVTEIPAGIDFCITSDNKVSFVQSEIRTEVYTASPLSALNNENVTTAVVTTDGVTTSFIVIIPDGGISYIKINNTTYPLGFTTKQGGTVITVTNESGNTKIVEIKGDSNTQKPLTNYTVYKQTIISNGEIAFDSEGWNNFVNVFIETDRHAQYSGQEAIIQYEGSKIHTNGFDVLEVKDGYIVKIGNAYKFIGKRLSYLGDITDIETVVSTINGYVKDSFIIDFYKEVTKTIGGTSITSNELLFTIQLSPNGNYMILS